MAAVHDAAPAPHDPFVDLIPEQGVKLTPRHYAYLKISEGCHNRCTFCIIPKLRGDLVSRPAADVLREAEKLVKAGVKELLVISQDTSAYGRDLRYAASLWRDREVAAKFFDLSRELGSLGAWVRLHYVYPYPHVDEVIALMAEGRVLPYLDIPFQHASPRVLKAMRRPGNQERTLDRIRAWRAACPDLTLRSTFIVGFPGETEEDFETAARLAGRSQARPGRRLRIRAGQGRGGERPRPRARPPEVKRRPPQALHAAGAGDQREKARGQGRPAARGYRRRGRRAFGERPHQGRRAADRRDGPHRDPPPAPGRRHRHRAGSTARTPTICGGRRCEAGAPRDVNARSDPRSKPGGTKQSRIVGRPTILDCFASLAMTKSPGVNLGRNGGRCRDRTCDPSRVKGVLYR